MTKVVLDSFGRIEREARDGESGANIVDAPTETFTDAVYDYGTGEFSERVVPVFSIDPFIDAGLKEVDRITGPILDQLDSTSHSIAKVHDKLVAEAEAFDADANAPTPFIDAECSETSVLKTDLIAMIVANRDEALLKAPMINAKRRLAKVTIQAAETVEEIDVAISIMKTGIAEL